MCVGKSKHQIPRLPPRHSLDSTATCLDGPRGGTGAVVVVIRVVNGPVDLRMRVESLGGMGSEISAAEITRGGGNLTLVRMSIS